MIRRLRRKFVTTTMLLAGLVLIAVCALLFVDTARQQREQTLTAMRRVVDFNGQGGQLKPQISRSSGDPGAQMGAQHAPAENRAVFWVTVDAAGNITGSDTESVDITQDTLAAVTAQALAAGSAIGSLDNPDLRYQIQQLPDGTRVVFGDRTAELSALRAMLLRLAAAAGGALLALFAVSVFLARMAVRPVEQAWERQRQFLADASHELKTPLTVIMADTSILLAHPGDTVAAQQKWLDGIAEEGVRMKKLVDDLLFLARSDAAPAPVIAARVDLSDTVMSSALSFESVAFEKGITLDPQVEPGLFLLGDPAQLKQLTAILVDNACKYAAGEKQVRIALNTVGQNAVLRVENTGPDIPPQELEHVFERFYRTEPSRARSAGGYGLGLAIAKTIATAHRAAIRAESGGGKTAFVVSFPLKNSGKIGAHAKSA